MGKERGKIGGLSYFYHYGWSEKSCSFTYSDSLHKKGQDFLDIKHIKIPNKGIQVKPLEKDEKVS